MRGILLIAVLVFTTSCAYTSAKKIGYESEADGIRVYDPQTLLIVTCNNAQLVSVPDFTRGYAIKMGAVLAKNNTTVKVTEGLLTEVSANLDDSALLSLLQSWGEKALGAAKDLAALGAQVPGTIPGMEGVWVLDVDRKTGALTGMTQKHKGTACPPK
jgi:hypothetical protein